MIAVMILNHNGSRWLRPLYNSLRAGRRPDVRVYLVDNGSTDDSVELTRTSFPEVTVLSLPRNMGYCMAYNLAVPRAFEDGCDWVVFANNDTLVDPDCLGELANAVKTDLRIGVLGPCFRGWEHDGPNAYMIGNHPAAIPAMRSGSPEPIDVDWVEGSFLMASRRCVEDVGPLDPLLFFSWEEADFCRRARRRGWRVVLVPTALARHYGGGSSATEPAGSAAAHRLTARNHYIYRMADPERGFAGNLLGACRLLLVRIKAGLYAAPSSTLAEIRVFAEVLSMMKAVHSKWRRDRSGGQPPAVSAVFSGTSLAVHEPVRPHGSGASAR